MINRFKKTTALYRKKMMALNDMAIPIDVPDSKPINSVCDRLSERNRKNIYTLQSF